MADIAKNLESKYPINSGYYHLSMKLRKGSTFTEQEAKEALCSIKKWKIEDVDFVHYSLSNDIVIIVGKNKQPQRFCMVV